MLTGLMQGCPKVSHAWHFQTSEIVGDFVHNLIVWVSEYKLDKLFLSSEASITGAAAELNI